MVVMLSLVALSILGLAHAYQNLKATQAVDAQKPLLDQGRYDEAQALLEAALKLQPNHPDLWEGRGRVLMLKSRFRLDEEQKLQRVDSVRSYHRAIALDPLNSRRMINLIEAHIRFSDPEAALSVVPKALKRDPNNAGLHFYKGLALQQLGRLDEARAAYQVSDRIAPNNDGARGLQSLPSN